MYTPWTSHALPSPICPKLVERLGSCFSNPTHHFKRIELLLNLLRQQWCQPIACGNIRSAIILAARPCLAELDAGTKHNILDGRMWWCNCRCTLSRSLCRRSREIVVSCGWNRRHAIRLLDILVHRCTGNTRTWRITSIPQVTPIAWSIGRRRQPRIRVRFYGQSAKWANKNQ